ncbi:MAG: 4-hydroxy-tetrahydrodipicolinate reductase [Spirochaetes bacterium]|nr:4-hydroxy-tetrahydrodipicolinate reductase [Spirochaetota bacterium]
MIKIGICGSKGRMSQEIINLLKNRDDLVINGLWEDFKNIEKEEYITINNEKVFYSKDINCLINSDIIIDFSHPSKQKAIYNFLNENNNIKLICGTTGLEEKDLENLKLLGNKTTIFYSPNMSYGLNSLIFLLDGFLKLYKDYDIELLETHHINKKDAPSGTLKKILSKIKEIYPNKKEVYDRHNLFKEKDINEIGISSIRSGGVKGIHQIIFGNEFEIIKIEHEALDRKVFANGVLEAINFIKDRKNGFFTYDDLIKFKINYLENK